MWLGIVANSALAIPTLIAPQWMLSAASLPPATPLLWTRFSAWLLLLLSLLYVPSALDCYRYMLVAWLAVIARLAGVVFFSVQPSEYYPLRFFDLMFFVPELLLLMMAMKARPIAGVQPL